MKKARLMKIFDIQTNYQKHKVRLLSIQNLDSKRKVSFSTNKNVQAINNYKKNKLTSDIFVQKQKINKITHQNSMMHTHLIKVYKRDQNQSLNKNNSKTSLRSHSSSSSRFKIKQENQKIKNKLASTKSTYSNFRKNIQSNSVGSRKGSMNPKDQLVNLLENQLGIKPRVVFPHVKKRFQQDQQKQNHTLKDMRVFDQKMRDDFKF